MADVPSNHPPSSFMPLFNVNYKENYSFGFRSLFKSEKIGGSSDLMSEAVETDTCREALVSAG